MLGGQETELFDRTAIAAQIEASQAAADEAAAAGGTRSPYRRRKKSNLPLIVGVLLLVAALVGGSAIYLNGGGGPLRGQLTAVAVDDPDLLAVLRLPDGPGTRNALAVAQNGGVVTGGPPLRPCWSCEATAGEDGLQVRCTAVEGAAIYRIDLREDANAQAWLDNNAARLSEEARRRVTAQCAEFARGEGTAADIRGLLASTNSINACRSLGGFVAVAIGSEATPVLAEPEPGVLLVALPKDARTVSVLPTLDAGRFVPDEFAYDVQLP